MAGKNQPDRWESLILAGALAAAGTWFLFDKLAPLMHNIELSRALDTAPAILIGVAVSLLLATEGTEPPSAQPSRVDRYE
jgi:hypothetical protein